MDTYQREMERVFQKQGTTEPEPREDKGDEDARWVVRSKAAQKEAGEGPLG